MGKIKSKDIELYETHDLDLIAKMDKECFPGDEPYRFSVAKWWVVSYKGEPVAYGGARYWPPDNAVFLCRAGTLPKGRGMGLQRLLINKRVRWARRIKASCAYTYTAPYNAKSSRNLCRCGFLPWSPGTPWAGEYFCYWIKNLKIKP
jgi:GNAT superfamily N-acetyltransferase